jgi:hypothetical protein
MPKNKHLLIFDPYFDTLGGGEQYLLAVARTARDNDQHVVIGTPHLPSNAELKERFQGDLTGIDLITMSAQEFKDRSLQFDTSLQLVNEYPLVAQAKKNIAIIQFPFLELPRKNIVQRQRIKKIISSQLLVVYSDFVGSWVQRRWHQPSHTIYPFVAESKPKSIKKNMILSVGRFFDDGYTKRQDILIEAFMKLSPSIQSRTKLILAGGLSNKSSDQKYFSQLVKAAKKQPNIVLKPNVLAAELSDLFSSAKIFWSANGYQAQNPGHSEHFGIVSLEAITASALPILHNSGGSPEIVATCGGLLWDTPSDLVSLTEAAFAEPPKSQLRLSEQFLESHFRTQWMELLA